MKQKLFILMFLFIFLLSPVVFANENIDLTLDKTSAKSGDEITVLVKCNEESKNLAYTAKLSYDKEVFEEIKKDNFQEQENWSDITYNSKNNQFALIKKSKAEENAESNSLLDIKLKVKENAKAGKTTITLNSITASDGKKDIPIDGEKVDLTVIKDASEESESIPTSSENEIKEDDISINVNKEFPGLVIFLAIVMFLIVIFVIIYDIKNDNSKERKIVITLIGIVIFILLLNLSIKKLNQRNPDINKNGTVDYEDTKEIIDYLLDIKNADEDSKIEDKDLNNDGEISVTDVVQSTNNASNQNYSATITGGTHYSSTEKHNNGGNSHNSSEQNIGSSNGNTGNTGDVNQGEEQKPGNEENPANPGEEQKPGGEENPANPGEEQKPGGEENPGNQGTPGGWQRPEEQYKPNLDKVSEYNHTPKKGEDITLQLDIEITPYTEVKAVVIDGKKYPVQKVEKNRYSVTVPAPNLAGQQDIVITDVVLDNGKQVKAEYKVSVDVLKEEPTLGNVKIDTEKAVPEISFDILDEEGSLVGGKVVVKDEAGNIVFESDKVSSGNNSFSIDNLEKDKEYNVTVEIEYDLDSNVYGNPEDNSGSKKIIDQSFKIDADYGFNGENWNITEKVTSNDNVIITFENSYDSYYDVQYVVIAGEKYTVIKEGNTYRVEIKKGTKGENQVVIEKVILTNGVEYEVNKQLNYTYMKSAPTFADTVNTEITDSKLKVTLDIQDEDNTLKQVKVYLTDEDGNEVDSKILGEEGFVEFDINEKGSYKIKVEYTYDLGDGEVTETKQYDKIIKDKIKVKIINCKITDINGEEVYYVEKGQSLHATFTIETNSEENINFITVNGINLQATKNEDGTYAVNFNSPLSAGETLIEVSNVELEASGSIDAFYSYKIEVLKSVKPTVEGISVVKTSETPVLAFVVKDEEESFCTRKNNYYR